MKYAIIGAGGISRVHRECIDLVGGELVRVCDINRKLDITDTDYREVIDSSAEVIVICTPNYLHYPMAVDALDAGKKVICEKPHALSETEMNRLLRADTKKNLYPVLQLRYNPDLKNLKSKYSKGFHEVDMLIQIHRSTPYWEGWKGKQAMSGGLLFNIGVHYFDFLRWYFGEYKGQAQTSYHWQNSQGILFLERAAVRWHLNIQAPEDDQRRFVKINGEEINLSYNFQNLHQEIYKEVEAGVPSSVTDVQGTYALIENIMRGQ
jgi:UDP-N-acetyl-2-amino-2-deoxyglucuronate dehydrogenase